MRTLAAQTMVEVPLDDGSTWTGTEAQLRKDHPDWVKFARIVQPTRSTREDYVDVEEDLYDDPRPGRLPTSSRTYVDVPGKKLVRYEYRSDQPIQRRRSAVPPAETTHAPRYTDDIPQTNPKRQKRPRSRHWLVYLGVGMLAMLTLWTGLQALGSWWQIHNDDVSYGRPRTYQLDAVFGHSDSTANLTHIIIVNLNRHVIIIELPGGDPSKSRIYSGPTLFGDGQDLTPVTGRAVDVNGDGKLDLVLFLQDQRIVYINDGTQFRPAKPGEHVTLPQ
jgi:hypothetical protein